MSETSRNWKLIRPLLRGMPVIAAGVALCVLLATLYLKHAMPVYESTAKIRLADPHQGEGSSNLYKDLDIFSSTNIIGTEVEMLKSKVILAKTLDSMDLQTTVFRLGTLMKKELYHDAPFRAILTVSDPKWYGRPFRLSVVSPDTFTLVIPGMQMAVRGCFDKAIELKGARVLILKKDSRYDPFSVARQYPNPDSALAGNFEIVTYGREATIDMLMDRLDITSVDKDVPILRMIYKSHNPGKAADFVNILANTYVDDYVERKVRAANITVKFLDRQLKEMSEKLALSESHIEDFKTDRHIINIRQETETDLRKIAQLKIQLANMKMNMVAIDTLDRYILEGKKDFLSLAPNFEAFTDLLSTELIKKIKQLQSDREDLLLKYTEKEDRVKVIDEKIGDITSYLLESIKNTRKNYEIKYLEIDSTIREAEHVFDGLPSREKTMAILEREFGLDEKNYDYLRQKRTEAQILRAATVSFHRIIAPGMIPEKPVSPNKVLIIAISAIMGMLLSISLIYAIHGAKAKVNDASAIEKNSEIPLVAEVQMLKKAPGKQAHFNDLATRLELRGVIAFPGVITYSSFGDREGKSYNAFNMACALVALEKTVLLVDVGGGIPAKQDWRTGFPDEEGICQTPIGRLFYCRAAEENAEGVVIRTALLERTALWKKRFDAIVIRNTPLSSSANSLVYMAVAESNFFLLDARRTAAKKIREVDLLKERYPIPGLSFVLNRSGYNPSLLIEIVENCRILYKKINRKR